MFREKLSSSVYATSFEEVYLAPGMASLEPSEIDLSTFFSRNTRILIPISSSPMDTVTEEEMAIALALLGGIGVVHRNIPVERQVEIVRRVKSAPLIRTRSLFISSMDTCYRALEIMRSMFLRDIPVVDDGRVVGHIQYSDAIESCRGFETLVGKLMKPPKSIEITRLNDARRDLIRGESDTIAVISREGFYLGTLVFQDLFEDYTPAIGRDGGLVVGAAISPFDFNRVKALDPITDVLVSDVAHAHNINVLKHLSKISRETSSDLVVGNIASYQAVRDAVEYIERIDGFRVGLGGGSICITPEVSGAYMPTLYAVASVRDAVEDMNLRIPVIADGGIRSSADIVRALAAGASSVMLGSLLAGTDEASAPLISLEGELYKPYRGMASKSAMERRFAVDRYARVSKRVAEGIEVVIPYKGSVYKIVRDLVEGVRAGLGYAGASSIRDLWEKAVFIRTRSRDPRGSSKQV
ncbi:MAG: IMP dehydrogenase [Sulfolobales archaeon]